MTADEFALAKYLIKLKVDGHELPTSLPDHLFPPSMYAYKNIKDNVDENGGDTGSIQTDNSALTNGA